MSDTDSNNPIENALSSCKCSGFTTYSALTLLSDKRFPILRKAESVIYHAELSSTLQEITLSTLATANPNNTPTFYPMIISKQYKRHFDPSVDAETLLNKERIVRKLDNLKNFLEGCYRLKDVSIAGPAVVNTLAELFIDNPQRTGVDENLLSSKHSSRKLYLQGVKPAVVRMKFLEGKSINNIAKTLKVSNWYVYETLKEAKSGNLNFCEEPTNPSKFNSLLKLKEEISEALKGEGCLGKGLRQIMNYCFKTIPSMPIVSLVYFRSFLVKNLRARRKKLLRTEKANNSFIFKATRFSTCLSLAALILTTEVLVISMDCTSLIPCNLQSLAWLPPKTKLDLRIKPLQLPLHIFVAITKDEVVGYQINYSAVNNEFSICFLRNLLIEAQHKLVGKYKRVVILLDNASPHRNATFQETTRKLGVSLVYTTLKTPDINPVELLFEQIKRRLKKHCRV